ncbi:MAG: PSD1 domain-containing protein [Candidatus Hydrogenedentes bacterium]|nr:PSD1 domain-containing protein [Candidatus Hydrogenedentota bacterium]
MLVLVGGALLSPRAASQEPLPERIEFNRHVRPILSNNCFLCHGPDKNARESGLRLDIREEALAERDGMHAIVPGDLAASEVVRRILSADPDEKMPPVDSERHLSEREIAVLTRWIEEGAAYEPHWAYVRPELADAPAVATPGWVRNPVDRYVLHDLEAAGLGPSPEADRVTLIRRLSFDLIGLPPTSAEVEAFVGDASPDAYERLVERLLASPHYGERMAIYWLDLVRYADTVGYHGDQVRGMAPYRDYVIQAFNENMPFDQFTREQLAGDLLEKPTVTQQVASGFNRLNMVTREGGAQAEDYLARYAADRVRTTATAWLGSSMGCAQCHDHKFDPFTIKDFYSFGAFFADIEEEGVQNNLGNEGLFPPFLTFPDDAQRESLRAYEEKLARLEGLIALHDVPSLDAVEQECRALKREKSQFELGLLTSAITVPAEPRMMRVLPRGNWMDDTGEVVTPAVPAFLGGMWQRGERPTRLDLAAWLTDRDNPLTARVFVNRLWKQYFGVGIARVLDDFGSQGEWPKHPELLDCLAVEFMERGWDVKHMVRLLVTSAAYRQTSVVDGTLKERDPENRMIARQSRFRLPAELVRDNALRVSGLIDLSLGGRSVFPYQPAGYYSLLNFPTRDYPEEHGRNLYRRGVYMHWQRTFLHPGLVAFDAPSREECTAERVVSNSPQQALTLLNDPIYVEAARCFAERILAEGGESADAKIAWAYREALSRQPEAREVEVMRGLYEEHYRQYLEDGAAAEAFIRIGEKPAPEGMAPAQLAAWSSVSRTLLNLHETIYRY